MTKKLSQNDWLQKAAWEGGIIEAIRDYGLKADDLTEKGDDFYEAIKTVENALAKIAPQLNYLETLLENLDD